MNSAVCQPNSYMVNMVRAPSQSRATRSPQSVTHTCALQLCRQRVVPFQEDGVHHRLREKSSDQNAPCKTSPAPAGVEIFAKRGALTLSKKTKRAEASNSIATNHSQKASDRSGESTCTIDDPRGSKYVPRYLDSFAPERRAAARALANDG